jgi:hypothetical protein
MLRAIRRIFPPIFKGQARPLSACAPKIAGDRREEIARNIEAASPDKIVPRRGRRLRHGHRRRYLAYSNFGLAFRASLVAPSRTSLLSTSFNWETGTAMSCFATARKLPALTMA